jgi:hypothetical protein
MSYDLQIWSAKAHVLSDALPDPGDWQKGETFWSYSTHAVYPSVWPFEPPVTNE